MPKPATLVQPIHFEDYDGAQFERLVFAYHARTEALKSIEWYGQTGSDLGRDIWLLRSNEETICIQCANRKTMTFAKVQEDLAKVLCATNGVPTNFRIVTRAKVSAALRDKIKGHVLAQGVKECDIWSGMEFEEFLRHKTESLLKRFVYGEIFPDTESALTVFAQNDEWTSIDNNFQATKPSNVELLEAGRLIAAYRTNVHSFIAPKLPPMQVEPASLDRGLTLIDTLLKPMNMLMIGPSGSTKTFHLQHLALAMIARSSELPVFVDAKSYAGGLFSTHVRRCAAPFFSGDYNSLMKAAAICELRPVLLVDALNECPSKWVDDLLKGLQEFALERDARLVGTSQSDPKLTGSLRPIIITMPLPTEDEKELIYAYHAGLSDGKDVKYLCAPFTNAYDLELAGLCHSADSTPASRTDLYDRYVRRSLPNDTALQSAFLRAIAGEMSASLTQVMRRSEFERKAEHFLIAQQAKVSIVDDLLNCRLLDVSETFVSFEHELLFIYFRAEQLVRNFPKVLELSRELQRPRNHELFELIVPHFSTPSDIEHLMLAAPSVDLLCLIAEGKCGLLPKMLLEQQCTALMELAEKDLERITARCESVTLDSGRKRFTRTVIENHLQWGPYSRNLCIVIARNLNTPCLKEVFLSLLKATERRLEEKIRTAALSSNFRPSAVWAEAVRSYGGTFDESFVVFPCSNILSAIRSSRMFLRLTDSLPIQEELLQMALSDDGSHLALHALNIDIQSCGTTIPLDVKLDLAERGLLSQIGILHLESIDLLRSMRREMDDATEEQMQRGRELLETFDTPDIMLNSLRLEVLASYGGLELVVTEAEAIVEMRSVINADRTSDDLVELARLQDTTIEQVLSQSAYHSLSKMFEDIFQGVYWDAFHSLEEVEKKQILCLAAKQTEAGFWSDWVLSELSRFGDRDVLEIFHLWASGIDVKSSHPQEAVTSFMLAIYGCAKYEAQPPEYRPPTTADDQAWAQISELLFWHFRQAFTQEQPDRINHLWDRLARETPNAAADALYQLKHCQWRTRDDGPFPIMLETLYPEKTRLLLEYAISHRASLTSIFQHGGGRDIDVIRYVIGALGDIGNQKTIGVLEDIVEDAKVGKLAIRAIAAIRSRIAS